MDESKKSDSLDILVEHNRNLVKTAVKYRDQLHQACQAMMLAIDCAEIFSEENDEPAEYIVPADVVEGMRDVLGDVRLNRDME